MKAFEEWVKDYNPNNVTLGPIVLAYLKYVYEHLDDEDGVIEPLPHGLVGKYDVYLRIMAEMSRKSQLLFPEGYVVQTTIMTMPVRSAIMETDEAMGVNEDGVADQVRFIRHMTAEQIQRAPDKVDHPKPVRKNAGKWLRELIDEVYADIPEQVKNWTCEMFAQKWKASNMYKDYELHVDKAFWKIYNPAWLNGDFSSCMAKRDWNGNWTFYINSVEAHAAYLTKRGSKAIEARCVVFDDVKCEDTGEHFRYAERQYSSGGRLSLQTALVEMLKANGYIDIYKEVGASCHERTRIVDFSGNRIGDKTLSIKCSLINGDNISYQDSFGYYSTREHRAYNRSRKGAKELLGTTAPWYYNEESQTNRPNSQGTWIQDNFHRMYVDSGKASAELESIYYYDAKGEPQHGRGVRTGEEVLTANCQLWLAEDVIEFDNHYYPRKEFVRSNVDSCMIPKVSAVRLSNGDYCLKENMVQWEDGSVVHKSSIVFSTAAGIWTIKEECTEVNGIYIPLKPDSVRLVDGMPEVKCTNGRWRNICVTEWDNNLHGFYDLKDYVNAYRPFRISDKDKKWEWRQVRTRKDEAWKCGKDGRWYHRYWVIRNSVDGEPMPKVPRIKFKGIINDAFCTVADWKLHRGKPVRYGLNEQQYKDFQVLHKAIQKNADNA